jgi:hypothetical protein
MEGFQVFIFAMLCLKFLMHTAGAWTRLEGGTGKTVRQFSSQGFLQLETGRSLKSIFAAGSSS